MVDLLGPDLPALELELGVVFLRGRGVWHVDAGDGRTRCGLELGDDVQLALAGDGDGCCRWCVFARAA